MSEVKCFKLKGSGEEFIAKLLDVNDDCVNIEDPVVLSAGSDGRYMLLPFYAISADRKMSIKRSNLLCFGEETIEEVADQYKKQFGMIHTPTAKIIV